MYSAEGLGFLPPTLTDDFIPRRSTGKEMLTEITVADVGDETAKSLYLIVSEHSYSLILSKTNV